MYIPMLTYKQKYKNCTKKIKERDSIN